jgi:hypothetical protein
MITGVTHSPVAKAAVRFVFQGNGCWGATGQKTGVRTARPRPPGRLPVSGVAVALPG